MKWRLFKLDWRYAAGELIIVTVGVLIALWVDQWRQEVSDSQLERQYGSRLIADLQEDINRFEAFKQGLLAQKIEFLSALESIETVPDKIDTSVFDTAHLRASIVIAIPEAQSTTFREMESSGNTRLIDSEELRVAIEDYYDTHQLIFGILANPIGDFRKLLANSVPGSAFLTSLNSGSPMPEDQMLLAVSALMESSESRNAINAELHYSAIMLFYLNEFIDDARELRTRLIEAYGIK